MAFGGIGGWGTEKDQVNTQAFRWESGGMAGLGDLPGGISHSIGLGVSSDGSVVVGMSRSEFGPEAFRWTESAGMQPLGDLLGGTYESYAGDVSADGSTVVGSSRVLSDNSEAFIWTESEGIQGLGDLDGGTFWSEAHAISADGTVIVGNSVSGLGDEAFIWDASKGMRSLGAILSDDFGLDLVGWTLGNATGISDDNLTIVGTGTNPDGYQEAWIATIPEPATLTLLALGGLALRRRRNRQHQI